MSHGQEIIAVHLRKTLLLPLDDLLAVMRELVCSEVSRSGLDRCLRRHGVGNLRELLPKEPKPAVKKFKAYEPGFVHIDVKYLPQMQDECSRSYLFVAIDRATKWVFVQIKKTKTAAKAKDFLKALNKACPLHIQKILTDNGKEFTDKLLSSKKGQNSREPTGEHQFDQLCQELGIEHRLTPVRSPQTNGMVERFNGRISDDLTSTLQRYVHLYNQQLPQPALGAVTPMQAM